MLISRLCRECFRGTDKRRVTDMNLKKMICCIIITMVTLPIVSFVPSVSEAKSYKSSFSNRGLRSKFGLSGSGNKSYYKLQRKYEQARERDYQILLEKMKNNGNNKD